MGDFEVGKVFGYSRLAKTDLTWEEKNSSDYRYHPKDISELRRSIKRIRRSIEKQQNSQK